MKTVKRPRPNVNRQSAKKPRTGVLITFEGIDGSGKSTQAELARAFVRESNLPVELLREPGSTELSERIRSLLLDPAYHPTPIAELLLYEAARAQLVEEIIRPLLKKGYVVLCDRYVDSTMAYQSYGRKLSRDLVERLNKQVARGAWPHLTLVYDLPLEIAFKRRQKEADRLEQEARAFHERVRRGFKQITRHEPKRVKMIDATQPTEKVFEHTRDMLRRFLRIA